METNSELKVNDKVKVIKSRYGKEEIIKSGVIARLTSKGACIYDPRENADTPEWAEWFPFTSRMIWITKGDGQKSRS